jgi:hypothetical protein
MTKEEETKNNQRTQTGKPEDRRRANGESTQHRGTGKKKKRGEREDELRRNWGRQGTNQKSRGGTKVILRNNAEGAYKKDEQRKQKEKERVTIVFAISSTRDRRQRGNRERKKEKKVNNQTNAQGKIIEETKEK